ncbi:MAG: family 20 glycosylhydrolase [Armatimonadetes bacterium]|nr:family 20 glycosylhydrolase [Armatimonadota bacterium]
MLAALAATVLAAPLPVIGLHLGAPAKANVEKFCDFITKDLKPMGVNLLVLEVDYDFQFKSHPEMGDKGDMSAADAKKIASTCKAAGIELVPQTNLLGHQSWAETNGRLLAKHPEFDETPGKYKGNKDIYCRSYCPNHPGVHQFVFDLVDEIADAFDAKAFHVGLDEVFILGDKDCKRCAGKSTASLFAQEVNALHDHFKSKGRRMYMWGDRFLDGRANGLGEWEAATNGTESAVDMVPKDIVICDWHYEKAEPTAAFFAYKGFDVLSCPWRKADVAKGQVAFMRSLLAANKSIAAHAKGVLATTWTGAEGFIDALHGKDGNKATKESAETFRAMVESANR